MTIEEILNRFGDECKCDAHKYTHFHIGTHGVVVPKIMVKLYGNSIIAKRKKEKNASI